MAVQLCQIRLHLWLKFLATQVHLCKLKLNVTDSMFLSRASYLGITNTDFADTSTNAYTTYAYICEYVQGLFDK